MKLIAGRRLPEPSTELVRPQSTLAILASKPAPEVSLARLQDRAITRDERALGLVRVVETNHNQVGWAALALLGAAALSPVVLPVIGAVGTWSGVAP